jgi:hypothetical protein
MRGVHEPRFHCVNSLTYIESTEAWTVIYISWRITKEGCIFFQGITIKPLVKILNVKRAEKRKPTMNERIHERVSAEIQTLLKFTSLHNTCVVR